MASLRLITRFGTARSSSRRLIPSRAYRFAKPIVLATLKSDYVDLPEVPLKQILVKALNSRDAATVSDATALVHDLGEHGFDAFGELVAKGGELGRSVAGD